ncbi:MAG: hypothetical protein MJ240_05570 [Kiritimatiellae bacterium]|nr:hypothetical protein [Kiritimatiellia bacterium]
MRRMVIGLLAMACMGEAQALDAVWDRSRPSGDMWIKAANWQDAAGAPLGAAPTNANDTAQVYAPMGREYLIRFARSNPSTPASDGGPVSNIVFRKVSSEGMPTLLFGTDVTALPFWAQAVTVEDPDDFTGFWTTDRGRARLNVKATASHTPVVSHFDTYGYNAINVPDAGTAVRVRSLMREGALLKEGAGELRVEQGAGGNSHIYVAGGKLTLEGAPAEHAEPYVPAGAWLHLDASRPDTFDTFEETYNGTQKRTCIARWRDCDGGDVYAETNGFRSTSPHLLPYSRAPFLSAEQSTSGLPLVDFGVSEGVNLSAMPSNCWLKLNQDCTVAREVFYVAYCNAAAAGNNSGQCSLFGTGEGVERYDFCNGGNANVFVSWAADAAKGGEICVNGQRALISKVWSSRYGSDLKKLYVASLAFGQDLCFNALGTDRCYSKMTGGWRVGEILVYSRPLSADERRALTRHLMRKWHKDYRADEVGEVVLRTDTVSIDVPDGRVARIKSLSTQGAKIVKTGGGTLVVDGIAPSGVPLDIRGGAIRVESPVVTTNAPAANPMIWLDATVASSLVRSNDLNGVATDWITRWNDRRAGVTAYYAEIPPVTGGTTYHTSSYSCGHLPKVLAEASPTGLTAIDMGNSNNGAWLWLQPRGGVDAYAGFVVIRVKNPSVTYQFFGTSNTDLLKNNPNLMIQENWGNEKGVSMGWAINGRAVDPWFSNLATYYSTDWRVVSFAGGQAKARADLLGKYADKQDGYVANVEIGEFILFDRPLSAEERRNTEAYLMRKWLNQAHPESPEGMNTANYTFAEDVPQRIDVGAGDVVVTNLVGGSGVLEKYGPGSLKLADEIAITNLVAAKVEAGVLALKLDVPDDSAYRFDASDLSSFTETYTTDDGVGGLVTNILVWTDQTSGLEAKSAVYNGISKAYAGASGSCCTNPTLVSALMPDGVCRPAVDFGGMLNVATLWQGNPRVLVPSAMNNSAGFKLVNFENQQLYKMREAHVIVADQDANNGRFFGSWGTADDTFARTAGRLFSSSCSQVDRGAVYNGKVCLDGQSVDNPSAAAFSRYTFHLVSIQPTNAVTMSTISMDRNCNSGGNRISEVVAYRQAHSPEVFDFIQKSLMAKWLGAPRPDWIRSLTELRAAKDATLAISTPSTLAVQTLSGGGTIAAPVLKGISAISVDDADTPIMVDGQVTLATTGTLTVTDMSMLASDGVYDLLVADALTIAGADGLAGWTLVAEVPRTWRVKLVRDGNALKLKVQRKGIVVNFR